MMNKAENNKLDQQQLEEIVGGLGGSGQIGGGKGKVIINAINLFRTSDALTSALKAQGFTNIKGFKKLSSKAFNNVMAGLVRIGKENPALVPVITKTLSKINNDAARRFPKLVR